MAETILVLDDAPAMARTAALLLMSLGYIVVQCENEAHAIHQITTEHFDLLLCDYEMPKLTGLEVVGLLREKRIMIPAIIMSGNIHAIDRTLAAQFNISEVLQKPFSATELKSALKIALRSRESDLECSTGS